MPFTSQDDMIYRITTLGNTDEYWFSQVNTSDTPPGNCWTTMHSIFVSGHPQGPAATAPSGTPGVAYTSDVNCITFPNVSPSIRYLTCIEIAEITDRPDVYVPVDMQVMVYDRLVAVGAIACSATGNQTVNSTALPRYTGTASATVQCWLEITTQGNTTAPVVDLNSYTQDDGTSGISAGSSLTFPGVATGRPSFLGPMPLNATSKGLRSIQVGLHVGTAGPASVVAVTLIRPLATISLSAGAALTCAGWLDLGSLLDPLPQIFDGASLELAFLDSSTANNARQYLQGCIHTAYTP